MNEDEVRPPYSAELLADLHAGALDEELAARLWPRVRRDPEAVAYLARLDATQARLSALRDAPPKSIARDRRTYRSRTRGGSVRPVRRPGRAVPRSHGVAGGRWPVPRSRPQWR